MADNLPEDARNKQKLFIYSRGRVVSFEDKHGNLHVNIGNEYHNFNIFHADFERIFKHFARKMLKETDFYAYVEGRQK